MIQRKQTLFLLQLVFLSISLLFVRNADVVRNNLSTHIFLIPLANSELSSNMGHYTAIALNFTNLILSFAAIFLYKKRHSQIRLIYLIILIWGVLGGMMAFCPFVERDAQIQSIVMNYFTIAISAFAIVAGLIAIRYIKKDIALLKSADRLR